MKDFYYEENGEIVKSGDKVIIEIDFPENFSFNGKADTVLKKLLEDNNGVIKKP